MAALVFAGHLEREGLADRVRTSSAGIGNWHVGQGADLRTVDVLRKHGYRSSHVAAQVGEDHLDADLVVALDVGHDRVLARYGVPAERRRLLRSFDPDADDPSVPDPYGGDADDFELVYQQIEAAMPNLLDWVRARVGASEATGDPAL